MKKRIIYGLVALMTISAGFVSCGDDEEETTTTESSSSTTHNNGTEGKVTIVYEASNDYGATGSTAELWEEVNVGSEITIKGQGKMECAGKTFVGWNTKKDGTGTLYKEGDKVTVEANLVLYSIWQ
ncbi:MAG: InlB B-repeat-containing protein [Bacteroidales bacterium]|nr:InlB B-repeat-containing protein [Bacteroidales bacterium]